MAAPHALDRGARPAITRRDAASSVAERETTLSAPCVLASLGARVPGIHDQHEENR